MPYDDVMKSHYGNVPGLHFSTRTAAAPEQYGVHASHRPFYTLHPVHSDESLSVPGLSAILKIALFIQPAYKINSVPYFAVGRQKL